MATRKKKTKKDKLLEQCEDLWKETCKKRDGKCIFCGSMDILQVHHVYSRQSASTFLDINNGTTLCKKCHAKVTFNNDFKTEFTIFLVKRMGEKLLTSLRKKSKKVCKWTIKSLEAKKKELEKKLEEVS